MSALQRFKFLFLVLAVLLAPLGEAKAQSSGYIQYFPETGHTAKGDFLQFYKNAVHPEIVYGFPITEQFTSRDGRVVQYFQRARFELGTGASGSRTVELTPLGAATYESGNQKLNINNPSACKNFHTGYPVCFAFLDFYEANGGEAQFGTPISPFEFHENLIVQYFERARFEWHADKPEGQRVTLTDLGQLYFNRLGEDQAQLQPIRPLDATISPILSIHARAFVRDAITQSGGRQTVHVIVQSQTHQPISNANGKATVRFSNNQTVDYFFTTNSSGLGSFTFDFDGLRTGQLVPIDIIVTYQELSTRTSTSFRIWY